MANEAASSFYANSIPFNEIESAIQAADRAEAAAAALPSPGLVDNKIIASLGGQWVARFIVGADLPAPTTVDRGGVKALPVSANEVLSGIATDGTPTRATTTGTGDVVRATAPTFPTTISVTGIATCTGGVTISGTSFYRDGAGIWAQYNGGDRVMYCHTNGFRMVNFAGSASLWGCNNTGLFSFYGTTSGTHTLAAAAAASGASTFPNTTGELVNTGISKANAAALVGMPMQLPAVAVDFNAANTDHAINVGAYLPTGITRYQIGSVRIINTGTTASLTTATCGVFTNTGGGGTAIVASATALSPLTSNAAGVNGSLMQPALAIGQQYRTDSTLYFRTQTAQGASASGFVSIQIIPFA